MATVALFPGSFDPFTKGHLDILKRALTIFDEVVVAVGVNQDKHGFYSTAEKKEIIAQATRGMEGVRNMTDFDAEQSTADANRRLASDIETIIIPTAQEFSHISSSIVRDLIRHDGDTSLFMPEGVKLPEKNA